MRTSSRRPSTAAGDTRSPCRYRATGRTGRGPVDLATVRAAIIATLKDAGYLHIPKAAATMPPRLKPSASTVSIRT